MGELTDKVTGKTQEVVGAATGDRELEAQGKSRLLRGRLKEGFEAVKRGLRDAFRTRKPQSPAPY